MPTNNKSSKVYAKKEKLEYLRAKEGYNQKEFAEDRLGVSLQWYNQIEREVKPISPGKAKEICDKLDRKFDQLFKLEEGGVQAPPKEPTDKGATGSESSLITVASVENWGPTVEKVLAMLDSARKVFWAGGILTSWISREGVGKRYRKKLKEALKREVDVRILINKSPEVLLPVSTGDSWSQAEEKERSPENRRKAADKLVDLLESYRQVTEDGGQILKSIRWFPHGDIRVCIADQPEAEDPEYELLMAAGELGGGDQPRSSYHGLVINHKPLVEEHKTRFRRLWEKGRTPSLEKLRDESSRG